jgi:hypothetical protein
MKVRFSLPLLVFFFAALLTVFLTGLLAGSLGVCSADVGALGCTDRPNNCQRPATRLVQHLEIDLHRFAGEIAFEMQHALLLIEPGGSVSCGAITVKPERSTFFEAISEKD